MILLIRHGETPGNAARVVQTPDTPLSERGLEQARRLAVRLAGVRLGRILSSEFTCSRICKYRAWIGLTTRLW